jgi:hypothetical protein
MLRPPSEPLLSVRPLDALLLQTVEQGFVGASFSAASVECCLETAQLLGRKVARCASYATLETRREGCDAEADRIDHDCVAQISHSYSALVAEPDRPLSA